MSRAVAVMAWLEDKSDWISPIVVKEVRQLVRGREFAYSFGAGLVAGLAVAFFGAADALGGNGTTGSWTFFALISCVGFLGLGVVPLGAFSALRNERMEQTLELITLTELSPRRIIVGKLLAQAVKLTTLFAGMAPFVTMSFLLGGIDFATILVSLVLVFLWSLWACAACLFLSTLLKSRAMSGLVFGAVIIGMFLMFALSRAILTAATRGSVSFSLGVGPAAGGAPSPWWFIGLFASFCVMGIVNLVLLAENRLRVSLDNEVLPLRLGFLLQFLVLGAWLLPLLDSPPRALSNLVTVIGVFGGWHLAIVAMFAVSDDLVSSRRLRERAASGAARLWIFRTGGGNGALYVLLQMALFLGFAKLFGPSDSQFRWLLAICGYILFFTGVPTALMRALRPARIESLKVRVVILVGVPAALVLPDLLFYLLWRPEVLNLQYGARHLINPIRTLSRNWGLVESQGWVVIPLLVGLTGLLSYGVLIQLGARMASAPDDIDAHDAETSGASGADAVY